MPHGRGPPEVAERLGAPHHRKAASAGHAYVHAGRRPRHGHWDGAAAARHGARAFDRARSTPSAPSRHGSGGVGRRRQGWPQAHLFARPRPIRRRRPGRADQPRLWSKQGAKTGASWRGASPGRRAARAAVQGGGRPRKQPDSACPMPMTGARTHPVSAAGGGDRTRRAAIAREGRLL